MGTLMPPVKGHEIKKDISMLSFKFSFLGAKMLRLLSLVG
jgi:hypothetical protein